MKLTKEQYNQLPEEVREELAKSKRDHWGMFYDSEWTDRDTDLEVIEDSVVASVLFRWLVGKEGGNAKKD